MTVHVKTVTGAIYALKDEQDKLEGWDKNWDERFDGLFNALITIQGADYLNFPPIALNIDDPRGVRRIVNLAHVAEIWETLAPSEPPG